MTTRVTLGFLCFVLPVSAQQKAGPSVEQLVAQLGSKVKEERYAAAAGLGRLGRDAAPAVPALIRILSSDKSSVFAEDPLLPNYAEVALACIGPAATPSLIRLLRHKDYLVRVAAASTLALAGPASAEAAPAIASLLDDEFYHPRYKLQVALAEIGSVAIPVLVARLSRGGCVGYPVRATFAQLGKPPVPSLIKALQSKDRVTRVWAARALAGVGVNARDATGALIKALQDHAFGNRLYVVTALGRIGPAARAAVPPLLQMLKTPEEVPLDEVVETLGRIGHAAQAGVPLLRRRLLTGLAIAKAEAGLALWRITGEPDQAVRVWSAVLGKHEAAKARPILTAVTEMGDGAAGMVPALLDSLSAADKKQAEAIERALSTIGKPAVGALTKLLGTPGPGRLRALPALEGIGPDASSAVPALTKLLESSDAEIRNCALWALKAIGPVAKPAAPAVLALLRDEDSGFAAAAALGRVPASGERAVSELLRLLKSPRYGIVECAMRGLGLMGSDARGAVSTLTEGCANGRLLWDGIVTLGRIGPDARSAVGVIRRYVDHPKVLVRILTAKALWRILGDERDLVPILRAIRSPLPSYRRLAVQSLADLAEAPPVVIRKLLAALGDPDWRVREAAAAVLGQLGEPARPARARLQELATNVREDERVRHAARLAITQLS